MKVKVLQGGQNRRAVEAAYIARVADHLTPQFKKGRCTVHAATRAVMHGLYPLGYEDRKERSMWSRVHRYLHKHGVSTPGRVDGNTIRNKIPEKQWNIIENSDYNDPLARGRVTLAFNMYGKPRPKKNKKAAQKKAAIRSKIAA